VVSRTYGLLIAFSIVTLSVSYTLCRPYQMQGISPYHVPEDSKLIEVTWEEFLGDCGGEIIVENYVRARSLFNRKYESNQVLWTGHVAGLLEAQKDNVSWLFGTRHSMSVLIKMSPSESGLYADLALSVSSDFFKANQDLFKNQTQAESHRSPLHKGDEVLFRAKFVTLGDEFKMHHLHLMEVQPTGNRKKLDDIVIRESSLP
jgi:hypothetical protein